MNTRKHILVFFAIFGFFLVPVGNIMTIQGSFAKGDDSSIYLVDFDETAYDLYLKGYYPSDYTYADFRRDSIESMTSHYVATDSNNFTAIVDTIENDILQNGWSVIDNFFENAWINLKSGDITVERGFTDDFKHELDGRFKTAPSLPVVSTTHANWLVLGTSSISFTTGGASFVLSSTVSPTYYAVIQNGNNTLGLFATESSSFTAKNTGRYPFTASNNNSANGHPYYAGTAGGYRPSFYPEFASWYTDISNLGVTYADLVNELFDESPVVPSGEWNGDGYYSNTPTNYSINLPALPSIDWLSISTNNKTKYGIDFPDVDLTIDFQLPDSYYPQSVTYDTPYWLYNTDSTPVDWQNVSFDDVTLPDVQLSDGDGSFFQALFNTLPLAFVPILLGVILCYLIFLML